jgi:hypothetical protein
MVILLFKEKILWIIIAFHIIFLKKIISLLDYFFHFNSSIFSLLLWNCVYLGLGLGLMVYFGYLGYEISGSREKIMMLSLAKLIEI